MKKLLLINGHMNTGGVEKSLLDVLQHLDYERYEVDLLLLEGIGDYADQIPKKVNVIAHDLHHTYGSIMSSLMQCIREKDWLCFRMRLIFLLMKLRGVEKLSKAKKLLTGGKHYDCVIGFRSGICTQIAAYAVDADRRLSWWHHGEINVDLGTYPKDVAPCNQIAVVSDGCREMLQKAFPTLEGKMVIVPNMLDEDLIVQRAAEFVPPYVEGRIQIVSVGRLAPEKHFENIVMAAEALKEAGIDFQWHIVGDGPKRSELEEKVQANGLEVHVIFEGNQPNPYPYMKYADLFVHPSYVESQGIVVMEAMALGVPCVVTKSLGPCEFIEDGVNGILTEQSPESLTEKVLEMLNDQERYEKIKTHTVCPEQFQPECVMRRIEKLLGD